MIDGMIDTSLAEMGRAKHATTATGLRKPPPCKMPSIRDDLLRLENKTTSRLDRTMPALKSLNCWRVEDLNGWIPVQPHVALLSYHCTSYMQSAPRVLGACF